MLKIDRSQSISNLGATVTGIDISKDIKSQDKELLKHQREDKFWDKVRSWQNNGWEISMHGYTHIYDSKTNKKDYFNYGGDSEFFGHSYDEQVKRLESGLRKLIYFLQQG